MSVTIRRHLLAALFVSTAAAAATEPVDPMLLAARDPFQQALAEEVLLRNPGLHVAGARSRAVRLEAPQARALPDPSVEAMAFALPPETRVGPQRLTLGVSQSLPWAGKLALKESAAVHAAEALEEQVLADRVSLVTEVRSLYYELLFVDRQHDITAILREHLVQHEEISRSRYATGGGSAQGVIKLQAEITRVEKSLLDLDSRQIDLIARINRLRDRPADTRVERAALPEKLERIDLDPEALAVRAGARRHELRAAQARIAAAESMEALAHKAYRPDFVVGLTYTLVDPRDDAAGRLSPPAGNGDDILGIRGVIRIPLWRDKLAAGVEQAIELQSAAASAERELMLSIESTIGDLSQRVPLAWRQLRLVEDLLVVQAEEAVDSALAGYVAGTLNALDLLDAEHILSDAQTAVARAKTDYLVGLAKLEGAVGEPIASMESNR